MENNLQSMFQTATDDMKINNDEIDEEEENADQLRRNQELAENLEKYLQIEDETIDHFETSVIESQFDSADHPRHENELCRLRNELISKDNEVQTLKRMLQIEKQENHSIYNDFKKKLRLFEVEKERAIMTKNQTHDLLVESKTEVSNLQTQNREFKLKLDSLEEINSKLLIELQQTKIMLTDLQHQQHNLELNMRHKSSSRIDVTINQLQAKHNAQVEIMQQRIDNLSSKLNGKENMIRNLDTCNKELEKSREALIIEKSEVINQLTRELETQQKHIFSNSGLPEENLEIQKKYKVLLKKNEELEQQVLDLTDLLEKKKPEVVIKEEDSKTNTNDIKKLKSELIHKNEEIQRLKNTENKALIEANEFKEMQNRLTCRIKNLEDELILHKNNIIDQEFIRSLKNNNSGLQKELTIVLEDCEKTKKLYMEACEDKHNILKKLDMPQNISNDSKDCSKCHEYLKKMQEIENQLFQQQSEMENYLKDNTILQQQLWESKTSIEMLKNKLAFQAHQSDLINELKDKAEQFEQFMKISRSNYTNNIPNENASSQNINIEAKIMEEVNPRCAQNIDLTEKFYEDDISKLKEQLKILKTQLEIKSNEVESVKQIILKERKKAQELMLTRETNSNNILNIQSNILHKCKLELQSYQRNMECLLKEFKQKSEFVDQEKESIALLQKQILNLKLILERKEKEFLKSIDTISKENINKITHIKEKYKSVKKIAQHYKVYSEQKEQHMLKEYSRLKDEYKKAEQKLQKKMSLLLSENEAKYNQRLREIRMEYLEKLKNIKSAKEVFTSDVI